MADRVGVEQVTEKGIRKRKTYSLRMGEMPWTTTADSGICRQPAMDA